jgi:hypothetical protein
MCCLWGMSIAADAPNRISGDIDVDGHVDSVSFAMTANAVLLKVRFGQTKRPEQSVTFAIGAGSQDSLHSAPKVSLESMDFDPNDNEVGALPGYQRTKICKGIVLDDGETDPIHVYWDHGARRLAWWRL